MNVLKPEKKLAVLMALSEGCSVRSVVRMTGVHKKTILKLLVEVGNRCQTVLDEKMRGIRCEAVECDELWTFITKKERVINATDRKAHPEFGDAYTFIALDPTTKLAITHLVGKRDKTHTDMFVADLSQRIAGSTQISTDGFQAYISTIQRHFGHRATHGEIVKMYASENPGPGRYAPPRVSGVEKLDRWGLPDHRKICTSYVERHNLTLRMKMARFHRLTLAFSRKLENLKAAVALYFWNYNFCMIHRSLRVTPAMAAGITDRVWELSDLVAA
ncbi:MAG TPA: IS1 family transposase [Nitrospiraceae bacterium]|nr:IS1 family transposase [Nitrospiraceae bacterium]